MKRLTIILTTMFICLSGVRPLAVMAGEQPTESGRLYGIGSVSKVFTAAAVMKLVDEEKINLDEPLTTYISNFEMADSRYVDITPRMLLNHSSGLMGMTDNNAFLMGDNDTYNHDRFLGFLQAQTLKHQPGNTSIYSNDSFTLAEILVEEVSGMSFTEFIEMNFLEKLGLENIKTPQSDFNRDNLAAIYSGSNEMKPENLGVIGSGGIYASMEDLCRFAAIFMDSADGSMLSKQSVSEMAKNQHKNQIVDRDVDTAFSYGLGWDGVNTYPFNQYGIKAVSKGGATGVYHTNLTVLPEHNLAVAVSSSGQDSKEHLIAQEIILEILREEGLIDDTELVLPELNISRAQIPEGIKAYAGLYATMQGLMRAEFTNDTLALTPIGVRNERSQEYIYNSDGKFISTNGDYVNLEGLVSAQGGTRGITSLEFSDNKYITIQTYESAPGLSQSAYAMPVAEKVEPNPVTDTVTQVWKNRNDKEYLLTSEKYSSAKYMGEGLARIHTDDQAPGYVGMGIYQGAGKLIKNAKIIDERTAIGYQSTPTMVGRDINNLRFEYENGNETLIINNYRYIDAANIADTSEVGESVSITSGAVWFDVTEGTSSHRWRVTTPEKGSWFTYDDKMNCISTSLEKHPRDVIILPEDGRIVFVGEIGSEFQIINLQ